MKRTAIVVFSAQAAIAGTQLVIFAILGSVFGAEVLGGYALTLSVATPVFLLMGLSLRVLYVTAEQDWSVNWYLRCTLVTAASCVTVALAAQLLFDTHLSFALAVLTVKSFDLIQMSGLGVLHRNGKLASGSLFLILNAVVSCTLAGATAVISFDASTVVWASAAGSVSSGAAIWVYILAKLRISGGEPGRMMILVRRGIPLGLTSATISIALNLPTYALAAAGNLAAVAAYSVLANLRTAVNMVYGTVAQVKLHDFAESVRDDDLTRFRTHFWKALTFVAAIGIVINSITVLLGPLLVPMVFGVEADDWLLPLLYMAVGFMASGVIYVCDAGLSAWQRYHQQVWSAAVALGVTGVLLLVVGDRIDLTFASLALAVALGSAALCKAAILSRIVFGREEDREHSS